MSSPLTFKWLGWHGNNDAENMCVSSAYCCYSKESPFFFCIYLLFPSSSSVASYFCSLLDKQLDWKPFVFLFPPPLQYYCLLGSVPRVEKIIIRAPVFILFLKKGKKKDKNYLKYDISFQLIVAPVESEHITWCLSPSLDSPIDTMGRIREEEKEEEKVLFSCSNLGCLLCPNRFLHQ